MKWFNRAMVIVAGVLLLAGCLKYPLGDASKSVVDPKWEGYWLAENDQGGVLYVVVPFDERAYVVQQVSYRQTISGIGGQKSGVFKAWLTDVKGTTFLTAEPIQQRLATHRQDRFYQVTRIKLTGDKAQTNEINDEFEPIKAVTSAAELMSLVEKEVENPNLYKDEVDYRKLDPAKESEKALIDSIMTMDR